MINDLPPLPFTSTRVKSLRKDKRKARSKQFGSAKTRTVDAATTEVGDDGGDDDGERPCEFCHKVANVCVLMHCHACRRVYHAQCFVHAFKPYVDDTLPIWDQMTRLQLEAPERRRSIFRCAPCKAAFLDLYESGGELWNCDCDVPSA